jgi:hypothetical protein
MNIVKKTVCWIILLLPTMLFAQGIEIKQAGHMTVLGSPNIRIINGGLVNNGSFANGTETIIFSGNTTGSISGKGTSNFHRVDIMNTGGITVKQPLITSTTLNIAAGSKLTIDTARTLNVTSILTNNAGASGLLIKSSNNAPNGTLIFNNSSYYPVSATVQMYSKAAASTVVGSTYSSYKWQFFGIPLQSVVANPTFAQMVGNINNGSYINKYVESGTKASNNYWVSQGNTATLTPFTGYEVTQKMAKTISFQGQLVNNDFSDLLTYTTGAAYPGQHVYGNPYTSAINIQKIVFGDDVDKTVYLYNTGSYADWTTQTNVDGTAGQYIAIPQAEAGIGGVPDQIPSMQGFVIKALQSSSKATINIPYSSVAIRNDHTQRVRSMNNSSQTLFTRIDINGTRYADKMWIFTNQTCTRGFDNGWDGYKFIGSTAAPQLWATETAGDFQIDGVDNINDTYLKFITGEDTNYILTFNHESSTTGYQALYLIDLQNNSTTDISQSGSTYSFSATKSSTPVTRFKIVTSLGIATGLGNNSASDLQVYSFENKIIIQNRTDKNGEVTLYDISGQMMAKFRYSANNTTTIPTRLPVGMYLAKYLSTENEKADILIIK